MVEVSFFPLPTEYERLLLLKFRESITQLATELKDEEKTDDALLKWLRAREYNVDGAQEMLRKSTKWRAENHIDAILQWKPPPSMSISANYKYDICGVTPTGCPILTITIAGGQWDMKRVIGSPDSEREIYLKYTDYIFAELRERMKEFKKANPNTVAESQFILIADVSGLSMKQFFALSNLTVIRAIISRYEANYPESVKSLWVVNSSKIFQLCFSAIRPLMSGRTVSKVRVYGSNQAEWKEALLEEIPATQLSPKFGGSAGNFGSGAENNNCPESVGIPGPEEAMTPMLEVEPVNY